MRQGVGGKEGGKEACRTENRLFAGLSARERERALTLCIRKRFRRGEPVFSVGDSSEFIYILEEGHVRLGSQEGGALERILNIFKPGDIFRDPVLSRATPLPGRRAGRGSGSHHVQGHVPAVPERLSAMGLNFIRLISDRLVCVSGIWSPSRTPGRDHLAYLLLKLADS
jgi:hypothetical protein